MLRTGSSLVHELFEIYDSMNKTNTWFLQLQSSIPTDQSKNEDLQKQFDQLNATLGLLPKYVILLSFSLYY